MKNFKKILSVALSGVMLLSFSSITANSKDTSDFVYLGGQSFGVKFYNNGVIITKLESYYDGSKYICPAKDGGLKENDIIKEADGIVISTNEDLQTITKKSNGNTIKFKIQRNGKEIEKKVTPYKNTVGVYLMGAWVRDSCAGIGTVTYYDDNNNYFAALGHGICDVDTSALLPLGYGEVMHASISGVTKSTAGKAGSLNGYFTDSSIGNLTKNTETGIYGTISDNFYKCNKKIEVADYNEIKAGKAQLYTTIKDDKTESYDIEITKICNFSEKSNENFVIKITNNELLDECGGIVQGMSGSPIVQNGKLVGAVTHVFLNKPNEGYGVMVQNMVANYRK